MVMYSRKPSLLLRYIAKIESDRTFHIRLIVLRIGIFLSHRVINFRLETYIFYAGKLRMYLNFPGMQSTASIERDRDENETKTNCN